MTRLTLTLAALVFSVVSVCAQAVTIGSTAIGATFDAGDSNYLVGSRVTTPALAGAVASLSAYVGPVDALVANRQFQLAIYTDAAGRPGTMLAATAAGVLVPNAWNTLPLVLPLQPLTSYWLVSNTNGRTQTVNNLAVVATGATTSSINTQAITAYGTWPNAPAVDFTTGLYSLYATFAPSGGPPGGIPVTSTSRLGWDMGAASLQEAQGFVYRSYVDTGTPSAPMSALCVAGVPAFPCDAPLPGMAAGQHAITMTAGSGSTVSPISGAITVLMSVTAAPTTTTLAVTRTITTATLVATVVSPLGGTPDGFVVFKDAGQVINTAQVLGGVATFTTTSFVFGPHSVTAEYQGTPTFGISASMAIAFTVDIVAPANLRVSP